MTEDKFITFQKFNSLVDAEELITTLKYNGLDIQIEDYLNPLDITFSESSLKNEIRVKIKQNDIEKINHILKKQAEHLADKSSDDHYLYTFTDDELIEIIEKPDEWSKNDYCLSQKILKQRGSEINIEKVAELREKRIEELRRPEKGHTGWLIFGFISALLGGLFGVFIGWFHWTLKKTDPIGQQVYAFDKWTRNKGQQIFYLGLISLFIWAISWLLRFNKY